jgi:hypothetical protein
MSKNHTVKDLKKKIKRCLRDLFINKLEIENSEDFKFKKVNLYNIIYGIKKRKREILKLIYSYKENMKRVNISGDIISNENTTIDVILIVIN